MPDAGARGSLDLRLTHTVTPPPPPTDRRTCRRAGARGGT
uniref:Uncharacterized protein n=1 Tax=Arundo donax TaxID=35708 RepID=A0A0A8Z2U6_ARUDO